MIPYTKKDIVAFVSYENVDFLNLSEKTVSFYLKDKNGNLHDLYHYNLSVANEGMEHDSDEWYSWMREEIIPSRFNEATEVEYEYSHDFKEVPQYLYDCGFRDIKLFGVSYL